MKLLTKLAITGALLAGTAGAANAAVVVSFNEVGGNVVATVSGTLDLTDLSNEGSFGLNVGVRGDDAYFGSGVEGATVVGYSGFTGPSTFGTSTAITSPTSSTGSLFAFNASSFGPGFVFVAPGFVSGSALASTTTFAGASFASLGLTTGTYQYAATTGDETVTFNIGAGAVPEPATWGTMILGFGAVGGALRRRKQAARATISFA